MKRIFTILLFSIAVLTAKAQYPAPGSPAAPSVIGHITGTITDSLTKKPIDYATIALFAPNNTTPISGVVSDEKGNFKLDNIPTGTYRITVSFLGYPAKTISNVTTTPGKPDKNIGVIQLVPNQRALKEVTVTGQASLV